MTVSATSFNERLARIEAQHGRTKGRVVLHVGSEEVLVRSLSALGKATKPHRTFLANALYPIGFVAAFGLGMVSVVVSTAVKLRMMPLPSAEELRTAGDSPMILGAIVAIATSLGLAQLLRLNSKVLSSAQTAGVLAAIMTLHNVAFWDPDLAAQLFTPDWVKLQEQVAVPDSLIFRGIVVPFKS